MLTPGAMGDFGDTLNDLSAILIDLAVWTGETAKDAESAEACPNHWVTPA
jgi:hypothetical protein